MCKTNNSCLISVAISIVLAIASALAFFGGFLPGIISFVIAALILTALTALVIALVKGYRQDFCLCNNGICMVAGIIGTLLFGLIALAVELEAGFALPAILIGLLSFFAALVLSSLTDLLICLTRSTCGHKEC